MSDVDTFIISAKDGRIDIVSQFLQENKVTVDCRDKDGNTALMQASAWGFMDLVKLLLSHRADINNRNKDGSTAWLQVLHIYFFLLSLLILTQYLIRLL